VNSTISSSEPSAADSTTHRAGFVSDRHRWIAPSYLLRTYLGRILTGLIYLAIAWVLVRFIDVATTKLLAAMSGRQRTSAGSVMPLARRSLKVLAIAIAILATLSSWGYDTTALLAGLGVGGLAVALAAQKTIENLFGGIALTSDKPVLVGDFCRYGDKTGTVEDIGLRSTRIRTQDRTVVTVPNAEFSSLQIENFARRDKIWFRPILQLRKDTQPAQIRSILARLRELLERPRQDRAEPSRSLPGRSRTFTRRGNLLVCPHRRLQRVPRRPGRVATAHPRDRIGRRNRARSADAAKRPHPRPAPPHRRELMRAG
jgi:small-conductance mechanosensitive channel